MSEWHQMPGLCRCFLGMQVLLLSVPPISFPPLSKRPPIVWLDSFQSLSRDMASCIASCSSCNGFSTRFPENLQPHLPASWFWLPSTPSCWTKLHWNVSCTLMSGSLEINFFSLTSRRKNVPQKAKTHMMLLPEWCSRVLVERLMSLTRTAGHTSAAV